jgi:hypothetical protein
MITCTAEDEMADSLPGSARLRGFSDAFFAVIITIMVLELKAPEEAKFSALLPLWPTATSYTVSFWFVAVVWVNHHHLLHYAHTALVCGVVGAVYDEVDGGHASGRCRRLILRRRVLVGKSDLFLADSGDFFT